MLLELIDSLQRGIKLRCPCCGHGRLFKTGFRMHDHCTACDERFEREPGQWFGAVYINLGLTLLFVSTGFVATRRSLDAFGNVQIYSLEAERSVPLRSQLFGW